MTKATSRARRRAAALLSGATIVGFLAFARADAIPSGASGAKVVPAPSGTPAPVLKAPKLKVYAEPVYPPERLSKGEKGVVVLDLTIDATGKVINAKVTTSAGVDFDASALEAATKLTFDPATRDDKPIVATIPFRFTFDFKDVPVPPDPKAVDAATKKPKVGVLSGVVRTPGEDPLPGATVTVTVADKTLSETTDAKGAFTFKDLPPGKYTIVVASEGFKKFDAQEEVTEGAATQVTYRPTPTGESIDIFVKGDRPPREVTKRVIEAREITRIPGTNGDALKAILTMPGVGRPPGMAGILIVRGSAPRDTNVFIDGTLVPLVYHFGGLSSVVPSEILERIDFYPGNFGPEFGRVMGGIVDVGIRSPKKDGYHGLLQFDLIDGRLLFEGPIDDKTRFMVAGRRSWVDVWLGPVLKAAGSGVSTAPVYYDYQVGVERDLSDSTTARILLFGSDDRLAITLNTPAASDPGAGGDISTHTGFLRLQGRVDTRISKDVRWTNTLAYGYDLIGFSLGDLFLNIKTRPLSFRSDLRAKLAPDASLIVGMDILHQWYSAEVNLPPLPGPGEATGPFFARPPKNLSGSGILYRPAAYAMLDLSPVKSLKLLPGVRVDYNSDGATWSVSPRFAARFEVVPAYPKTTLKGGVGIFHQPAQPNESLPPSGTAGLGQNRATHYGAGFEQEITKNVEVSVEGFFKDLQNLVVAQTAENISASGNVYANIGSGRTYGMELLLRYKPDSRFFGWLSYTLSKSERRDAPGLPLHGFVFDQTHILTVLGSYKLGKGWEVGARFRYVTGNLYTQNAGGLLDLDAGAYSPVASYPRFASRLPAFHQLDIRIDKQWKFSKWALSTYLDVQNVYNNQSPEGVTYNYNYSQSSIIGGMPIIPSIGVRGEL